MMQVRSGTIETTAGIPARGVRARACWRLAPALLIMGSTTASSAPAKTAITAQLEDIEQRLAKASVNLDPRPYDRYWCADFVGTSPDGSTYTKAQHRASLTGGKIHFRSITVDRINVRLYDSAAVMSSHREVAGDYDGHSIDASNLVTSLFVRVHSRWCKAGEYTVRLGGPPR